MLSRRSLLRGALAAAPFALLWNRRAHAAGFGSLVPDPKRVLDLPSGFTYRIVDKVGQDMSDGFRVPGSPDGMACYPTPDGKLVLLRNHELTVLEGFKGPYKPFQQAPAEAYDKPEQGCVTRVVLDADTYERISSNLVLAGTTRNCQGGPTPWGWLSCEEAVIGRHGYVFLCDPMADRVQGAKRIPGYGRMNHEAAAVDPATLIAYLTEDRDDSCFYRFVPNSPSTPFEGQLQALKIVGMDRFDTASNVAVGQSWSIEWVNIDNPDPPDDSVRKQGQARGAARISRGEGLWLGDGHVLFNSTDGGPTKGGQIFRLDPDGDGGKLTVLTQSSNLNTLDRPDSMTMTPWGDLFLCEDGGSTQFIRILHQDGSISDFAKNAASNIELAGVCFSPDGKAMFVNLFGEGMTLAITGPFPAVTPPPPPPPPGDAGTGPRPQPTDPPTDNPNTDAGAGGDPGAAVGGCQASGTSSLVTAGLVAGAAALIKR